MVDGTKPSYHLLAEAPMANGEKLSIALSADMAATVRQAVASGDYVSASEVVREALRDWRARRAVGQDVARELRRLWDEGRASGSGEPLDMASIKLEARRRHEAGT
jgi:antitoxin ParD1/3/4